MVWCSLARLVWQGLKDEKLVDQSCIGFVSIFLIEEFIDLNLCYAKTSSIATC